MALQQQLTQPSQLVGQLGQDYATQLTGLTSVPLDTSQFAPSVAAQDPLQAQAATARINVLGKLGNKIERSPVRPIWVAGMEDTSL